MDFPGRSASGAANNPMICALVEIGAYKNDKSQRDTSFHLKRLSFQGSKKELIVKFTRRYSEDLHRFCAGPG
jgi:hypothetical protein